VNVLAATCCPTRTVSGNGAVTYKSPEPQPDLVCPRLRYSVQNVDVSLEATESDASFVIARTKLSVPVPRAGSRMVPRPHLVDLCNRGRTARLSLVCAPTGWGKTSLLAEWATATGDRFAWVSLDRSDDEPLRFWRCVVAALAALEPALASTALRRLRAPVVSIVDEVLPVLVNELADLARPLVLVLDDYHVIVDPAVHDQLDYLLSRLPPTVHLVIAAHVDPPLRLGRLRARGELAELRPEQLRFSGDEAMKLLNQVHDLDLELDEVETIQRQTEGWVGGLNLAALSLKRDEGRVRVLEALAAEHRFLVDYLWNEVVLSQPSSVRQFLMHTAILERLTGDLCAAVTDGAGGAATLRELERANLFVVPLDRGHVWFRYHHLFRGLLLGQLERFAADLIPELHRRASAWYGDHDFMVEAIEHAIAAGDVHYAADELERNWEKFYSAGETLTVLSWIDRLPGEAIAAHPTLALLRAALSRPLGQIDQIEPWLQRAEQVSPDAPAPGLASTVAGGAALFRSLDRLAVGDVAGAVDSARRGYELEPANGSREYLTAAYFFGAALFYQDPDQAQPLLEEFLDAAAEGERDPRHRYAMALLAETYGVRGELETAERLAQDALKLTRRLGVEEHPPTNQVHIALGMVPFARGELDVAEERFERAVTLARRAGDRTEVAHTLIWLARVHARQNDAGGGRDAFDAARELLPEIGGSSMRSLVSSLELELATTSSPAIRGLEGDALSEAELRILRLMPGDLTYREIAGELHLSVNTVRSHALRLRRKLGVSSRSGVVIRARERRLL
jgi:LuxR family transcriptional regulator, maltose regulon positive regulatory protein